MGTYQSKFTGEEIDGLLEEVRNGGGGSSSGTKKVTLWEGELKTEFDTITLSDSVENYDVVLVETCIDGNSGTKGCIETKTVNVSGIEYTGSNKVTDYTYNVFSCAGYNSSGSTLTYYRLLFNFVDSATISLISTKLNGSAWHNPRIYKVTGIKY